MTLVCHVNHIAPRLVQLLKHFPEDERSIANRLEHAQKDGLDNESGKNLSEEDKLAQQDPTAPVRISDVNMPSLHAKTVYRHAATATSLPRVQRLTQRFSGRRRSFSRRRAHTTLSKFRLRHDGSIRALGVQDEMG